MIYQNSPLKRNKKREKHSSAQCTGVKPFYKSRKDIEPFSQLRTSETNRENVPCVIRRWKKLKDFTARELRAKVCYLKLS